MTKKKKGSRKSNGARNVTRINGHGIVNPATFSSAGGFLVMDAYDLDTDLIAAWTTLGSIYEKWRIKKMTFRFITNRPMSEPGMIYMAVTDDPNESAPIDRKGVIGMRTSVAANHSKDTSVSYRPSSKGWFFTHDQIASDDRLEMPGVFYFCTESFTNSVSPGIVFVKYTLEFKDISNTQINSLVMASTERNADRKQDKDGKDAEIETLLKRIAELQASKPIGRVLT